MDVHKINMDVALQGGHQCPLLRLENYGSAASKCPVCVLLGNDATTGVLLRMHPFQRAW